MQSSRRSSLSIPQSLGMRSDGSSRSQMRQTVAVRAPIARVTQRTKNEVVGIAINVEVPKILPSSSLTKPADVAMNVIKQSYLRNLDVIDTLFEEKKKMEARMKILEEIVEEQGDQLAIVKRNARGNDIVDDTELTAAEAARRLFSKDDSHSAYNRRRPSFASTTHGRGDSTTNSPRPLSAPGPTASRGIHRMKSPVDKKKLNSNNVRPLPASLLADQDRYVQKKLMMVEQERLKKVEEDLYARKQRERSKKMKLSALNIDGLLARQKKFENDKKQRIEEIKREYKERDIKEKKERAERMKNKLPDKYTVKSWEEISQAADAKRKESIVRRKNELIMQIDAPSCAAILKRSTDERDGAAKAAMSSSNPKESPEDVAMRLQIEHTQWTTRIEAARLRVRADSIMNITRLKATNDTARRMEDREAALRMRRQERIDNQRRLEEVKEKLYREKQAKHVEQLMAQPLPVVSRRITTATKTRLSRARAAVNDRLPQQSYEKAEKKSEKDKFKDEIMSLKIELARIEYRKNFKDNKIRLKRAVSNRPSLISRHASEVLRADLRSDALEKFKIIYSETIGVREESKSDMRHHDSDDWAESKSSRK